MIDVNAPKEEQQEVEVEQAAKRARDLSFRPAASEEEFNKRAQVRQVLGEITAAHMKLISAVHELYDAKDFGEFVREVEFMFSLSFSETFCAIGNHAKSK